MGGETLIYLMFSLKMSRSYMAVNLELIGSLNLNKIVHGLIGLFQYTKAGPEYRIKLM